MNILTEILIVVFGVVGGELIMDGIHALIKKINKK